MESGDGDDEEEQESQEYQYHCQGCGYQDETLFRHCPVCTGIAALDGDQEEQEEEEEEEEQEEEQELEQGEQNEDEEAVEGPRDLEQRAAATSGGQAQIKAEKLPGIQRYDPVAQTAHTSMKTAKGTRDIQARYLYKPEGSVFVVAVFPQGEWEIPTLHPMGRWATSPEGTAIQEPNQTQVGDGQHTESTSSQEKAGVRTIMHDSSTEQPEQRSPGHGYQSGHLPDWRRDPHSDQQNGKVDAVGHHAVNRRAQKPTHADHGGEDWRRVSGN